MKRASVFVIVLLLAGCIEAKPQRTQAINEMIESPLQNTVISSFDTYPAMPVAQPSVSTDGPAAAVPKRPLSRS